MASAFTMTSEVSLSAVREQIKPSRPQEFSGNTPTLAVKVRGLVKRYRDGTEANQHIDLEVRRGEVVSILGPNGAGKTTFLRQLTTELRPTAGSISIFDIDAIKEPVRAKRLMGVTPQEAGVFERLSVREHLEFFARLKRLPKKAARAAAHEVIANLGLEA